MNQAEELLEFDCPECGRHLFQLLGDNHKLCGACRTMPGWHKQPDIRNLLLGQLHEQQT
jgi:hypothetical protein